MPKSKLIIIEFKYPVKNAQKTQDLDGECSPYLRDRNQTMPIIKVQVNSRLKGIYKFEVLLHELFHAAALIVFGYMGDEDFVTPHMEELALKYKTYLLSNKHKPNNKRSIENVKIIHRRRDKRTSKQIQKNKQ